MENVEPSGHSPNGSMGPGVVRQSDVDLLIAAYAGFNARKIDTVLALMHPEVDWPNGLEGGRVYGHDAVRDYWARQWSLIDPHAEPIDFRSEEDGRTTVTIHLVVRDMHGNMTVDENVEHSYLIEGGLIRRMDFGGAEV